jgi:hypothetical protein
VVVIHSGAVVRVVAGKEAGFWPGHATVDAIAEERRCLVEVGAFASESVEVDAAEVAGMMAARVQKMGPWPHVTHRNRGT